MHLSGAPVDERSRSPLRRGLVSALCAVFALSATAGAAQGSFLISGKLTAANSEGVSGAKVTVTESGTSNMPVPPTETISGGTYGVLVPAGKYDLTFTPPVSSGFHSFVDPAETVGPDAIVNAGFGPAGGITLSGRLVDSANEAIEGATIDLFGSANSTISATSASDGSFSLTAPAGTYAWRIEGLRQGSVSHALVPSRYEFQGSGLPLSTSTQTTLVLPTHTLTVHAVDSSATSVQAVRVTGSFGTNLAPGVTLAPGFTASSGGEKLSETTNSSGEATLALPAWLSGQKMRLNMAPPPTIQLASLPVEVEGISKDTEREIHLGTGVTLSGVLVDSAHEALEGASIALSGAMGSGSATTGPGGAFSLTMAPGTYSWHIEGSRQVGVSHSLVPSSFSLQGSNLELFSSAQEELVLPTHTLTIHAVGPGEKPILGVRLFAPSAALDAVLAANATLAPGFIVEGVGEEANESTDSEGKATLAVPDWAPGLSIAVEPPVETQLARTTVTPSGISEDHESTVSLTSGVTLSGALLDSIGEGLEGAKVSLSSSAGSMSTTTGAGGSFAIVVAPGKYTWRVEGSRQGAVSPKLVPSRYFFEGNGLELSASLHASLVLPTHTLTVRTVGSGGSPISGSHLTTNYSGFFAEELQPGVTLAPGFAVAIGGEQVSETTNSEGAAALAIPNWNSGPRMMVQVEPPWQSELLTATIEVLGISKNQTRLVAFGKSGTDTTVPEVQCPPPAGGWHGTDVTVTCTASDPATGLASAGDNSFPLSTNVSLGTETTSAFTGTHRVCDRADNCTEAGPIGPIQIDRKSPTITIAKPLEHAEVEQYSTQEARYSCTDTGSGVSVCEGSVAAGAALDTSTLGAHALSITSTDAAGNHSTASVSYTVVSSRDVTPPKFECTPDSAWHGGNAIVPCTASDPGSGLANPEDGSFTLSTNVGEGEETTSASTGTQQICDRVGNCVQAGPFSSLKVDRKPPSISIGSPEDGEVIAQGASVTATYTCTDGGSGVASCEGSTPSGSALSTASPGQYTLSVAATDTAGNIATRVVHYTVVAPGECGESTQLCQTGLGDTTPPHVAGLTVAPSSVDTSSAAQSVTVTVHATDDLAGVSAVEVNLSNGAQWITASAQLAASGTKLDGTWDATLTLPHDSAEGTYALSVGVIDNVGNRHTYSEQELQGLAMPSSVTQTGAGDPTPPQVASVLPTPSSVDTCGSTQMVSVIVHAIDSANVTGLNVTLTSPNGQHLSAPGTLIADGGTAADGRWSASLTLPQNAQAGLWLISVEATDGAGNHVYLSSAQLAALGYQSSIEQTCAGDTMPPQVASLTLSPESLDTSTGAQSVTVAVHATDDLSGVASLQATLSDGSQQHSALAALQSGGGTNLDGTWLATIVLPRWSRQGTWQLSLTATDAVGNTISLSPTQIAALGLPSSIAQTGADDNTPPEITAGSVSPSTINTSQHPVQVTLHLQASDLQSGTQLVLARFTSPSGNQQLSATATLASGTGQEGEWTAVLTFPQFSEQGGWHLSLDLWDGFGNHRAYNSGQLAEKGLFSQIGVGPAPTVTAVSPTYGRAEGGTSVTITGTNLSEATAVHFDGTSASSFTVNSATSITATAPKGSGETAVDVTVTTPVSTSETSSADQFTYIAKHPAPTLTRLSLKKGPAAGGATITITGTEFIGVTAVRFGNEAAASFTVNSTKSITATAPPNIAGTNVHMTVTTPNGMSPTSEKFSFTYENPTITGISPSSGPIAGANTVTIAGSGFDSSPGGTSFKFGKLEATGVSCTSLTTCTAVVPAVKKASTVEIQATVGSAKSAKTPPADQYIYF